MAEQPQPSQQLVAVRILGAPVRLWERSREYHEGLTREFTLLAMGDADSAHVPARLLNLVGEVSREYGAFTHDAEAQLAHAQAVGSSSIDLDYHVPTSVVPHARALIELLDQADEFCRAGDLLTMAAPRRCAPSARGTSGSSPASRSASRPPRGAARSGSRPATGAAGQQRRQSAPPPDASAAARSARSR